MEQIETNVLKSRVEITFVGSYSGEMASFSNQLKASARAAKASSGYFDILTDFTQAHVMPKDLLEGTVEVTAWCADNGLRKSANVVNSMLQKLQLDRLTPDERFQIFVSRDDAEAWLSE
jgi:hypothetical protein